MQLRQVDDWHPEPFHEVRFKEAGAILEVVALSRINRTCNIRNLDKDHYIYLPTGEVMEKNHMESRADNTKTVRESLSRLRDYINTNVTDTRNVRWITLTYKENMTNERQLKTDFDKFIKRYRYYHEKQGLPPFEYIVAMEPQGRGAWHAHLLLIYLHKAPFIPNDTLASAWGHGFVKITALNDVDNVGAYLTAYLADMSLEDEEIPFDAIKEGVRVKETKDGKRYIKGARLHMYPPKFNIYRCSRGIKPPVVERISEAEAMEKVGAATPTFERTIEMLDPESGLSIVINKRYFNRNRRKGQGQSDDAPISDGGIPNRPAGSRKFAKDCAVLQAKPRVLCKVYRANLHDRLNPSFMQVLYSSD